MEGGQTALLTPLSLLLKQKKQKQKKNNKKKNQNPQICKIAKILILKVIKPLLKRRKICRGGHFRSFCLKEV